MANEQLYIVRQAIKIQNRIEIGYARTDGKESERVVRLFRLFYWGKVWTLDLGRWPIGVSCAIYFGISGWIE